METQEKTWTIGEIARHAGIRASAIRFYEGVGLLEKPPRLGGWRSYTADALERLRIIGAARDLGFSLSEIKTLLDGSPQDTPPSDRWQRLARRKLPDVEAHLQRLLAMKALLEAGIACNCETVEECIGTRGESCLST